MSTYGVNKVGWLVVHDEDFRQLLVSDPGRALDAVELQAEERAMLLAGDVAGLYRRGAHELLMFNVARAGALGLTIPVFVQRIRTAADPADASAADPSPADAG